MLSDSKGLKASLIWNDFGTHGTERSKMLRIVEEKGPLTMHEDISS